MMDSNNPGQPSTSGFKIVTRKYLFDLMQKQDKLTFDEKLNYLESLLLCRYGRTKDNTAILKKKFTLFKSRMKKRWEKAYRKSDDFLKTNETWLQGTFEIPIETHERPGRPSKSFKELSERSKRRKTEEIRSTVDSDLILHAAQITLQARGQREASKLVKEIKNSPTRAGKYRKAYKRNMDQETIISLTPQQALQMFVDADLTKRQYEIIRNTKKDLYPCYNLLLNAKRECLLSEDCLRITSSCAEGDLQSLIDITIKRLSIFLEEVLMILNEEERKSLKIIYKWSCDGSNQAQYKQKFNDCADSDANIFFSSFVPLQIVCGKDMRKIVWQNPTPSSTRYCRPIRFRFVKESPKIIVEEISFIKDSIKSLVSTEISMNGSIFIYEHIFKMTMIDGKICNAATCNKSTSRCYICGATSKDFNDLSLKKQVNPTAIEFGLSVLHARIRIFESVLHLAYKLPTQKYRSKRTEEEKKVEQETKSHIQERFRKETGLLIDMPKANFGSTNDGNTSRRFFENPELASNITGVDYNLIYRLKVILETISSEHKINTEKFDEYTMKTAQLYVELYPWYPMSPTLHKILVHGATVIENALLPIGQLSEEAAEARNKHFRIYRENYSRKFSREACNRDIFNRLLLSSDPLLSGMRPNQRKSSFRAFCPETINMLMAPQSNIESDASDTDEDE